MARSSVLGRLSRALLAGVMVAAMAGAAVAFAVGVHFTPASTCKDHVSYGSKCPPPQRHSLNHSLIKGLNHARKHKGGRINLRFINHNGIRVTERVVLLVQSRSGRTRRIVRVFVLRPGRSFHLGVATGLHDISAVKLTLTVTDAAGDLKVIKRQVGKFRLPHHHRHP